MEKTSLVPAMNGPFYRRFGFDVIAEVPVLSFAKAMPSDPVNIRPVRPEHENAAGQSIACDIDINQY